MLLYASPESLVRIFMGAGKWFVPVWINIAQGHTICIYSLKSYRCWRQDSVWINKSNVNISKNVMYYVKKTAHKWITTRFKFDKWSFGELRPQAETQVKSKAIYHCQLVYLLNLQGYIINPYVTQWTTQLCSFFSLISWEIYHRALYFSRSVILLALFYKLWCQLCRAVFFI